MIGGKKQSNPIQGSTVSVCNKQGRWIGDLRSTTTSLLQLPTANGPEQISLPSFLRWDSSETETATEETAISRTPLLLPFSLFYFFFIYNCLLAEIPNHAHTQNKFVFFSPPLLTHRLLGPANPAVTIQYYMHINTYIYIDNYNKKPPKILFQVWPINW